MKKRISFFLLVCSLFLLLTACRGIGGYQEGKFFTKDFLKSVSLEDMPTPTCELYSLNNRIEGQETLRFETKLRDFETYVNSFIAYMNVRDDIYYFGIQESEGSIAEMLPHRVTQIVDGEFQWESSVYWYTFAYSLTDELEDHSACSEHAACKSPIIVKFEYDREEKAGYVSITTGDVFATDCIGEEFVYD